MEEGLNVLSLFDGMSCGRIALQRAGISVDKYYSSEIDKHAIKVADANWPQDKQHRLGDITKWKDWDIDWSSIDLVIGGFPCQAWSMAGKQLGDKDERGKLFWVMLDVMKTVRAHNQKADFLIENVKMKKEFEEYITFHTKQSLGVVHKILINSALVSAQNRNRYYWTSWECSQPEDKGIVLADILDDVGFVDRDKSYCIDAGYYRGGNLKNYFEKNRRQLIFKCESMIGSKINPETGKRDDLNYDLKTVQRIEVRNDDKTGTLTTVQKDNLVESVYSYRKLTPIECERLQTVPDNYTNHVSNTQRYRMLGNGWTIDVIAHILKNLNKESDT